MSVFKGFTLYEYSREYFVLLVRRGFEINSLWHKSRVELEKKLLEEKKKPQDEFKCDCELGTFLCIYDANAKSYFILLSNSKVQQDEQNALLEQILEKFKQNKQISKMTREEFDTQYKSSITDILEQAELQYIEKNGAIENVTTQQTNNQKKFRKDIELEIKKKEEQAQRVQMTIEKLITKQNSVQKGAPQKLIKRFMMFDLIRQYFFMVVNREKEITQKWLEDRNEVQKYILEQQKKQEPSFELKKENCTFYGKYNKEEKCYFIFYVNSNVCLSQLQDVVDSIYMQVSQTKKIAKINKGEIENLYLKQIEIQLDKAEALILKTVDINQISVIKETVDSKGQNNLIKSLSPQDLPVKTDNSNNHQGLKKIQNDEKVPLNL